MLLAQLEMYLHQLKSSCKVILAVTPTAPIVEGKENGSVTITPPTHALIVLIHKISIQLLLLIYQQVKQVQKL